MVVVIFVNKNATEKEAKIRCSADSLDHICYWYAAYHAGDEYDVYVNGYKRKLNSFGCIVGMQDDDKETFRNVILSSEISGRKL